MPANPDWSAFESRINELMERDHVPGAAVALSDHGRVVYARGFGFADVAARRPANEHTVFGVASVSKSFAALALMQLQDRGLVNTYAPLVRYLPEFRMRGIADREAVWLHHTLSHTTGCPPLFRAQGRFTEFADHIKYLADYETTMLGRPGEFISYCNDTFMLNGAVVERVSGQRYRDYVTEQIIRPLGMERTTFDIDELAKWDNVTNLYNLGADGRSLELQPWIDLGTYHVGGGVRSTVLDLLKYGDMYLRGGLAPGGDRLVSEAGVLRMRAPVHPFGEGAYYGYAMWLTPAYHGVTIVEHSGGQPGVTARWGFVPELGISGAVLTNLRGAPADQMFTALVNTALGLPPALPRVQAPPTFPVDQGVLSRLIGTYASDEGQSQLEARPQAGVSGRVIEIRLTRDGLVGEFDGATHPLRMVAPDQARYEEQGLERPMRWFLRGNDPAWAISMGLQMTKRAPGA